MSESVVKIDETNVRIDTVTSVTTSLQSMVDERDRLTKKRDAIVRTSERQIKEEQDRANVQTSALEGQIDRLNSLITEAKDKGVKEKADAEGVKPGEVE